VSFPSDMFIEVSHQLDSFVGPSGNLGDCFDGQDALARALVMGMPRRMRSFPVYHRVIGPSGRSVGVRSYASADAFGAHLKSGSASARLLEAMAPWVRKIGRSREHNVNS